MDKSVPRLELLLKEYELGIQYLTDHYSRMWIRFNFFITLNSALAVAIVGFSKDKWVPLLAIAIGTVGLITSMFWYVFGAQDRYYVQAYRHQIAHTADELWKGEAKPWPYVSLPPDEIEKRTKKVKRTVLQWRSDQFSVTKLAAAFPLLVVLIWLGVMIAAALLMSRIPESLSFTLGVAAPLAVLAVLLIITSRRQLKDLLERILSPTRSRNNDGRKQD